MSKKEAKKETKKKPTSERPAIDPLGMEKSTIKECEAKISDLEKNGSVEAKKRIPALQAQIDRLRLTVEAGQ